MTPQLWKRNLEWNEWRQMHPDLDDREAEYLYMAELKMFQNYQNELLNQTKIRQARLSGDLMNVSADISTILNEGGVKYVPPPIIYTPSFTLLEGRDLGGAKGRLIYPGSGSGVFDVPRGTLFEWSWFLSTASPGAIYTQGTTGIYEVTANVRFIQSSPSISLLLNLNGGFVANTDADSLNYEAFGAAINSKLIIRRAPLSGFGYPYGKYTNTVVDFYNPGTYSQTVPQVPEYYEPYNQVEMYVVGGGGAGFIGAKIEPETYYVGGGGGAGGAAKATVNIDLIDIDSFNITVGSGGGLDDTQGGNSTIILKEADGDTIGGISGFGGYRANARNLTNYPEIGGSTPIPTDELAGGNPGFGFNGGLGFGALNNSYLDGAVQTTSAESWELSTGGVGEVINQAYDSWPSQSIYASVTSSGKGGDPEKFDLTVRGLNFGASGQDFSNTRGLNNIYFDPIKSWVLKTFSLGPDSDFPVDSRRKPASFEFDSSGDIVGTGNPAQNPGVFLNGTGGGGGIITDNGAYNASPGVGGDGRVILHFTYRD